jgi:hypothetical protein
MTPTRYVPLDRLAEELRREQAAPYRQAAERIQRQIDQLDRSEPERQRLIPLAAAARRRARAIENGQ